MMINAGLICQRKDDTYLVPSMVTQRKEVIKIPGLQPSLYIDFKDETLPLAFYTRFQVELLMLVEYDPEHEIELYDNFIRLPMMVKEEPYDVIVVRHASRIEVAIEVEEKIKEDRKECEKIAKIVLNFLRDVLENIQKTHPCCKGLKYEFGLKCDLCCPKLSKCLRHGQEGCDDGNCVCFMSLERLKQRKRRRLYCSKNESGNIGTKLDEEVWFKAFEMLCENVITKEENEASTSGALNKESLRQNVITNEGNEASNSGALSEGVSSPVMVSDIRSLAMQNICRLLNVKLTFGNDFNTLAGELGMQTGDVWLISQTKNPSEEILKWWIPQTSATVEAFREILQRMQRHDVLAVLDEEKHSGNRAKELSNLEDKPTIENITENTGEESESTRSKATAEGNRVKELSNLEDKPTIEKIKLAATVSKTLSRGEKKNNRISLLFIGQDRVGKTSLKKTLLGEDINENEGSTIGIEFDVVEVNEDNKSLPWKIAEDNQFMASEDYAEGVVGKQVAREIIGSNNRLTGRRGKFRDKGERAVEGVAESDNKEENEAEANCTPELENRSKTSIGNSSVNGSEGKSNNRTSKINPVDYYKTDGFRRKVENEMKNVENYRDDTMDTIRFLVGDFAGQSVYYDVHSIMLRPRALFILVVDLSKPLHDEACPKFVQKVTKVEQPIDNPLKETNLDYVTRWGAAVRNLGPCNEEDKKNPGHSSQIPKIILVFTKPDKLGSPEEAEKKRKEAADILEKRFARIGCETVAKFVIRNTEPRNADVVKRLRETIFETAQNLLKKQDKTPVGWLMLERALDVRRKDLKHCPYIELDEARKLDKEFSKVNEKFEEAMKFLHQESIVVHFSENVALNNLVVLDASWLVQLFTKVLTVAEDRNWSSRNSLAWQALREKGELQFDNLPNPLDDMSQKEALKLMMVNAGFICERKNNTYLVPSMVTKRMEESKIRELLSSCLEKSLYIDFKDETLPLAFYTCFQVELLKLVGHDLDHQTELYQNFMRLPMMEKEERYDVIFVRHASRIEVAIKVDEKIKEDRKECRKVAKIVLDFLRDVVQEIQKSNPCCKVLRCEYGLKCDLCPTQKKCFRHGQESCDDGNCVCIMSLQHLKERKKQLLFCPNNNFGSVSSKLHEAVWFMAFDDSIEHGGTSKETDQSDQNESTGSRLRSSEDRSSEGKRAEKRSKCRKKRSPSNSDSYQDDRNRAKRSRSPHDKSRDRLDISGEDYPQTRRERRPKPHHNKHHSGDRNESTRSQIRSSEDGSSGEKRAEKRSKCRKKRSPRNSDSHRNDRNRKKRSRSPRVKSNDRLDSNDEDYHQTRRDSSRKRHHKKHHRDLNESTRHRLRSSQYKRSREKRPEKGIKCRNKRSPSNSDSYEDERNPAKRSRSPRDKSRDRLDNSDKDYHQTRRERRRKPHHKQHLKGSVGLCSINKLLPLVRMALCNKLDIEHVGCNNFRKLAGNFGMENDEISLISQEKDRTENVFRRIEQNTQNTIGKLREILDKMRRDDCVAIIDKAYGP